MTDIVERLRDMETPSYPGYSDLQEAADEIERLRGIVALVGIDDRNRWCNPQTGKEYEWNGSSWVEQ